MYCDSYKIPTSLARRFMPIKIKNWVFFVFLFCRWMWWVVSIYVILLDHPHRLCSRVFSFTILMVSLGLIRCFVILVVSGHIPPIIIFMAWSLSCECDHGRALLWIKHFHIFYFNQSDKYMQLNYIITWWSNLTPYHVYSVLLI